ncbi:hypothetical+protein [Methylocapsa aurea]
MTTSFEPLPSDLASAHALILAQRELLEQEQAARIVAQSEAKVRALEVERLKLLLAKARREAFGQSSERAKLLVEQLELAIEDLEEAQGAEEAKADLAAPKAGKTRAPRGPRGPRKLPENLPSSGSWSRRPALAAMRRPALAQARRGGDEDARM